MKPAITTKRLDIFQLTCEPTLVGQATREVFVAFFNDNYDFAWRPICRCTIARDLAQAGQHELEWIETDRRWRRRGVATEMLSAVCSHIGGTFRPSCAYEVCDEDDERTDPARKFLQAVGAIGKLDEIER